MRRAARIGAFDRKGRRARGFTMVELLVVMALIALLAGISASALSRIGQGSVIDGAWRLSRIALSRARVSAREQSALARVRFIPSEPSRIELSLGHDAGTWHLDAADGARTLGGRNLWARLNGASIVEGGTVRGCAELDGGDTIVCDPDPGYEPMAGFSLAMDVRPDDDHGTAALFSFGRIFSCELTEDGALRASLETDEEARVVALETSSGLLAPRSWARVELTADGYEATLRVHGVVEARVPLQDKKEEDGLRMVRLSGPEEQDRLTFGSKGFKGFLDEITYRTLGETEVMSLERGAAFALQAPLEVRFEEDGRLDRRLHTSVVVIPLVSEEERLEISVDLSGVIR